jgi:subtilisin family serine protease
MRLTVTALVLLALAAPAGAAAAVPSDPLFPSQWSLHTVGAPAAWDVTKGGRHVIVAVLGSGLDLDHPDLAGNLWTNVYERPGNGRDDEGNGFIDDVHGYDFAALDGDPDEVSGHGTHVAGTIAAVGDNSVGVTGVAWFASLLAVRVGAARIPAAVDYAVANGASVVHVPASGASLGRAVKRHPETLFVVPAPCPLRGANVICAGATNRADELVAGGGRTDLGAPGVDILSTWRSGGYRARNGSPSSAALISGAAALLIAGRPDLDAARIRDALLRGADVVPAGRRLNVRGALELAPPPPPPTLPAAPPLPDLRSIQVGCGKEGRRIVCRVSPHIYVSLNVVVRRAGRTVARASGRPDNDGTFTIRPEQRLKRGRYTVTVTLSLGVFDTRTLTRRWG